MGSARRRFTAATLIAALVSSHAAVAWGGRGHHATARLALRSLAGEAARIFRPLAHAIVMRTMDADIRVPDDPQERPRHFYDLEAVGFPLPDVTEPPPVPDVSLARRREVLARIRAQVRAPEPGRNAGTLPVAVDEAYPHLVQALRRQDRDRIVQVAADLSHYLADAHQPLHATDLFDGIGPGQRGVHRDFETGMVDRCPAARPRERVPVEIVRERPGEVALAALIESHALAARVLAVDLGCGGDDDDSCDEPVPQARARAEMGCELAPLARQRMELAAARTAALFTRAVSEASAGPRAGTTTEVR